MTSTNVPLGVLGGGYSLCFGYQCVICCVWLKNPLIPFFLTHFYPLIPFFRRVKWPLIPFFKVCFYPLIPFLRGVKRPLIPFLGCYLPTNSCLNTFRANGIHASFWGKSATRYSASATVKMQGIVFLCNCVIILSSVITVINGCLFLILVDIFCNFPIP